MGKLRKYKLHRVKRNRNFTARPKRNKVSVAVRKQIKKRLIYMITRSGRVANGNLGNLKIKELETILKGER